MAKQYSGHELLLRQRTTTLPRLKSGVTVQDQYGGSGSYLRWQHVKRRWRVAVAWLGHALGFEIEGRGILGIKRGVQSMCGH